MIEHESTTNKIMKSLCISGIAPLTHENFKKIARDKGITQSRLLTIMLNNYLHLPLEFNEADSLVMQQARGVATHTLDKKIKKMALNYAQTIIDSKNKPELETPVNIQIKNSAKAADLRADNLIGQIFKHNESTSNWYDKILITKKSIYDYAANQKQTDASNISMGKVVIDRCLQRNKELINLHHTEHKLALNHNANAYYERLKLSKRVEA